MISRVSGALPDGCAAETLFYDYMVVATGANNPLTRRRKIELAELVDEPWTHSWPTIILVGSWPTHFGLRAFAATNDGVVLLSPAALRAARGRTPAHGSPRLLAQAAARHSFLRALPVELPNSRHPVAIITLKNRELSPLAQLFCERVRAITKPLAKDR